MKLAYRLSPETEKILREAEALNDYSRWFGLSAVAFDLERRKNDAARLLHYFPEHLQAVDEQHLMAIVNQPEENMAPEARKLLNIRRTLQYCRVAEEPYGIPLLQKLHIMLLANLPDSINSGALRNAGNGIQYKDSELFAPVKMLTQLSSQFNTLANDKSIHPIERCWLLYYFLISVNFFPSGNSTLAIIFCYYFLQREGYGYRNLLKLEKYVLHSKKYMAYNINYIENKSFAEKAEHDLSTFLQICLEGFGKNLEYIRHAYMDMLKRRFEYNSLSPRRKNAINYWIKQGFESKKTQLAKLTPIQRDMLYQLYTHAETSLAYLAGLYETAEENIDREMLSLISAGAALESSTREGKVFGLNFA